MSCNKITYFSLEEATENADYINMSARNSRHANKNLKSRPYKCRYCGNWHLSSKKKQKFMKWRK